MRKRMHIFLGLALAASCFTAPLNVVAQSNHPATLPPTPPLPMLKSPMDSFRTLLVMPSDERRTQLARRPPNVRQQLFEKLREYEGLSPDERELRLKATELRWYLEPLMTSAPTNRAAQLGVIPESLRDMVAARIAQWDKYPPRIQEMMLTNRAGPGYFVIGPAVELPPSPQGAIHRQLQERFNRLFELTPDEQEKVLASLSDAERRQMEKTLAAFTKLTPGQRRQCLISFAKFAKLNPQERQEFLKNVDRWAQMPAAERQAWRELVSAAPNVPPLPFFSHERPPLPPGLPKTLPNKPPGTFSTNGG